MAAVMLRFGVSRIVRGLGLLACAVLSTGVANASAALLLPPPPPGPGLAVPLAGPCPVTGSETFSPNVTLVPVTLQVPSLSAAGPCVDNVFNNQVDLNMSG